MVAPMIHVVRINSVSISITEYHTLLAWCDLPAPFTSHHVVRIYYVAYTSYVAEMVCLQQYEGSHQIYRD